MLTILRSFTKRIKLAHILDLANQARGRGLNNLTSLELGLSLIP